MLYKEFEKNREDILENEFCMQSDASTLPITDCPSYTPICTIGICIQGNAKIRMDSQEYTIHLISQQTILHFQTHFSMM